MVDLDNLYMRTDCEKRDARYPAVADNFQASGRS